MSISRTKHLMIWALLCGSLSACENASAPTSVADMFAPSMVANSSTDYVRITKPASSALKLGDSVVLAATTSRAGRLFAPQWESTSPARASVGATTGKVIGKISGPVTIRAFNSVGSDSVVLTITTGTVVSVSPTTASVDSGKTVALTANSAGTWSSSAPTVATVNSTGTVSGIKPGTATITLTTSTGVTASSVVTVLAVAAAVTVAPAAANVDSGATITLTGSVSGTWSSANTAIATVSTTGIVTGVKPGSTTIQLTTSSGSFAISSITVQAVMTLPPPPPGVAEFPRVYLDGMLQRARAATVSRTINVSNGTELQRAIDTSRFGDEIVIQANVTMTGAFNLRKKTTGSGWITIRSANSTVPAGTRARPSTSGALPKVLGGASGTPVFTADAGAHNYRLTGFEVSAPANLTSTYSLIQLGSNGTPATQPDSIILDRMYIHGTAQLDFQRCVLMNSGSTVVVDSWLSDCHGKGFDSQAIVGWNGTGPYKIQNNYLEGAGENVMFGGADPSSVAMLPSDIEVRGNHFFKPLAWRNVWSVKNLFELKMGHRVLVEGNIFENNWADGQNGTAIVLKSVNQGGGAPYSETRDLNFRFNIVRNTVHAIAAAGKPESFPAIPMSHLVFSNNLFENIGDATSGRLWLLTNVSDVTFEYNTGFGGTHGLYMLLPKANNLRVENNIFGVANASYGTWDQTVLADGVGYGTTGLNASYTSWVFARNVMPNATVSRFPLGNYEPTGFTGVGFVAWPSNLRLSASSSFLGVSTTGSAVGVDHAQLTARTGAVVQTP